MSSTTSSSSSSSSSDTDTDSTDSDVSLRSPSFTCGYHFPISKWVYRKIQAQRAARQLAAQRRRRGTASSTGGEDTSSPSSSTSTSLSSSTQKRVHTFPTLNDLPRINYRGNTNANNTNNSSSKANNAKSSANLPETTSPAPTKKSEIKVSRSQSSKSKEGRRRGGGRHPSIVWTPCELCSSNGGLPSVKCRSASEILAGCTISKGNKWKAKSNGSLAQQQHNCTVTPVAPNGCKTKETKMASATTWRCYCCDNNTAAVNGSSRRTTNGGRG